MGVIVGLAVVMVMLPIVIVMLLPPYGVGGIEVMFLTGPIVEGGEGATAMVDMVDMDVSDGHGEEVAMGVVGEAAPSHADASTAGGAVNFSPLAASAATQIAADALLATVVDQVSR